eukprot:6211332-Pleurochrysis_carterae.AAC.1
MQTAAACAGKCTRRFVREGRNRASKGLEAAVVLRCVPDEAGFSKALSKRSHPASRLYSVWSCSMPDCTLHTRAFLLSPPPSPTRARVLLFKVLDCLSLYSCRSAFLRSASYASLHLFPLLCYSRVFSPLVSRDRVRRARGLALYASLTAYTMAGEDNALACRCTHLG